VQFCVDVSSGIEFRHRRYLVSARSIFRRTHISTLFNDCFIRSVAFLLRPLLVFPRGIRKNGEREREREREVEGDMYTS